MNSKRYEGWRELIWLTPISLQKDNILAFHPESFFFTLSRSRRLTVCKINPRSGESHSQVSYWQFFYILSQHCSNVPFDFFITVCKKDIAFVIVYLQPSELEKWWRNFLILPATWTDALEKSIKSSAYSKWEMRRLSTEYGVGMRPVCTHSCSIAEKNSMTLQNRYGDMGHLWLRPLVLLRKPHDLPLKRLEKAGSVIQAMIQLVTFSGKLRHCKAALTKLHLMLSNALHKSSLRRILCFPFGLWKFFTRSWDRRMLSAMDVLGMNEDWLGLIIFSMKGFNLWAIILVMIL